MIKEFFRGLVFFAVMYVMICLMFSFAVADGYWEGPYMAVWHWPLKAVLLLKAG